MALFYSLSPPLGSRSTRNAAELFSIELSLLMPQDRFLPAREIQAQVWTNIIHKQNPDGPNVWKEIPMSFSHVEPLPKNHPLPPHLSDIVPNSSSDAPAQCIAVFRSHLIPTGRGDFGLTCRWKSHRDQQDWQWATRDESENCEVVVRVPRNYAASSSWTLGPQSVLIMTKNGLRVPGVTSSTGPGLYLGNHGAASKAKLCGYDAVLSLVSDILDFDEKIPDPDTSASKNLWDPVKHQQQVQEMKQQLKEFAQRQEENETLSNSNGNSHSRSGSRAFSVGSLSRSPSYLSASRRSSVSDLGVHLKSNGDHRKASPVLENEEEAPRLSRKTSVTELMVKPPSSTASSKRLQSMSSVTSLTSADISLEEEPDEKAAAPKASAGSKQQQTQSQPQKQQQKAATKTTPSSSKKNKHNKAASKNDIAASLPPPPAPTKGSTTAENGSKTAAVQPHEAGDSNETTSSESLKGTTTATVDQEQQRPLSSSRVLSTIADHAQESNAQYRSRISSALTEQESHTHGNGSSNNNRGKDSNDETAAAATKEKVFSHKVIALSPGAHRTIADKDLRDAIEFLKNELEHDKKVLVHCRDGNGRSGSVVLAYMVAKCTEPHRVDYDEALQEVWKWKCDVYPHKGLRESIAKHANEWRDL